MVKRFDQAIPCDPPKGANLYSREFMSWRERYVALRFLECLGEPFDPLSVLCHPGSQPPDVVYNNARFEIKEVLDDDRKPRIEEDQHRSQEVIEGRCIQRQSSPDQAVQPMDVGREIFGLLVKLIDKGYRPAERSTLDMLFYYNRQKECLFPGTFPSSKRFEQLQFRSVSAVVTERVSLVFYASPEAPEFLARKMGQYCELP